MTTPDSLLKINTSFRFESYGVRIEIASNEPEIVAQAEVVARRSLLGDVRPIRGKTVDHLFELPRTKGGMIKLIQNGEQISSGRSLKRFLKFFDSILRVAVGEYAVDRVFLHAGVVSWRGKAIILPADSFQGKTTLVAELVRNGAVYYSDEFAVLDGDGLVHPFARPLSMRTDPPNIRVYELTPADLGGTFATEPALVGMVLLTGYKPGGRWSPKILTPGQGVLEMMPYALSLRYNPKFAIKVLNSVASRAIIASSRRGNAENFVKTLLNFVDKRVN